ncbi:hypothetical protein Aab01nite_07340 [Paractinoplanes abujensis]|uniref:Uncharacterized protein n=1 Tax=Paractinoplanes abujensis TaxID=882441 RepID=A0A7W7CMU5_9ACTN|nr:hypothetical protein [Actinoplanes abujensis]MBB4691442.1 hypothetical protein [Actinoplanes abujensis]GID17144.1 hypothetical protein Aab01nite_07340 [Actinoplanes abujensis]
MTLLRSVENPGYQVANGVVLLLDPGARDEPRIRGSFACSGAGWAAVESTAGHVRVRLESHGTEPPTTAGDRLDDMTLPFVSVTGRVQLA